MTRPVYDGRAQATLVCERQRPLLATIRPRVMPAPARHTGQVGRIERVEFKLKEAEITGRILGFTPHDAGEARLTEAEVVVAVGRGLGSAKHLPMVEARRAHSVVSSRARAPPSRAGGCRRPGRSGRAASPCARVSTWRSASPAPPGISPACATPRPLSPLTTIPPPPSSPSPPMASSAISARWCRR